MKTAILKKRIKALKTWGDVLAECFVSGWVNAADTIDEKELDSEDWVKVREFVTSETFNMHGIR